MMTSPGFFFKEATLYHIEAVADVFSIVSVHRKIRYPKADPRSSVAMNRSKRKALVTILCRIMHVDNPRFTENS